MRVPLFCSLVTVVVFIDDDDDDVVDAAAVVILAPHRLNSFVYAL